mmetsp:Transcript_7023/g.23058  ORF Transcript_7023/g.23058 Transcript_7023/m.23058 type:complete len:232 (-) Transcript_7023:655-1350(-)
MQPSATTRAARAAARSAALSGSKGRAPFGPTAQHATTCWMKLPTAASIRRARWGWPKGGGCAAAIASARVAATSSRTCRAPEQTAARVCGALSTASMSGAPRQLNSARSGARCLSALAWARLVSCATAAESSPPSNSRASHPSRRGSRPLAMKRKQACQSPKDSTAQARSDAAIAGAASASRLRRSRAGHRADPRSRPPSASSPTARESRLVPGARSVSAAGSSRGRRAGP